MSKKHTNPALPSNLVAPVGNGRPVLPNAVLRKELVQELIDYQADTALSRLVYFCAPAGWGKSVVMSQVFDRIAADGPGTALWLAPDLSDLSDTALPGEGDNGPLSIFIDTGPQPLSREQVVQLKSLAGGGANLKIYVAARHPCDDLCAALTMAGRCQVVDATALRFSNDEIESLTGTVRFRSLMADLLRQLDGWPIAVSHAAALLHAQRKADPRRVSERFRCDIEAFVRSEVTNALDDDQLRLFAQLCLFRRFPKTAIDEMLGEPLAAEGVAALSNRFGLIDSDDAKNGWYCIQLAIRTVINACGDILSRQDREDTHRKALQWFIDNQHTSEALAHCEYSIDAGRFETLLSSDTLIRALLKEGPDVIKRALQQLPNRIIESNRILAVTHSLGKLRSGDVDACEQWLATAKLNLGCSQDLLLTRSDDPSSDAAIQVHLTDSIIQLYLDRHISKDQQVILEWISGLSWTRARKFKGIAYGIQSFQHFLDGDITRSLETCKRGLNRYMAVGDQDFSELYCYVAGALSSIAQGSPQNADWYLQQAICKFPRVEVADQGLYCLLQLLEFEVQQEFGNYVAPNIILDVLADAERHEYFADLYVRGYSVACQSAAYSEGFDSAELVIGTAMQAASRLKISRLTYRMRSLRAAYLTAYGESDAALTELQLCGGSIAASAFWFERFCRSAAEARVMIAQDQLDDARQALATIEAGIDREMHVRSAVTLDCIRVQYLHDLGDIDQMCELLRSILLKAQYTGLRAPIYEEGLGLLDPLRILTAQHGSDAWFEKPRHWIEEFVDKLSTRELQVFAEANPANALTAQERRVMLLIKQGLQNKIVAHELNLAEATVKYHLRNIYKKLGVNNRVQALAAADPALNAETEKSS